MNVMILAAGEGTRLRPYTLEKAKPTIPFLTVPLACYPLSLLENIKIGTLVVNTYHLPDLVSRFFEKLSWPSKKLAIVEETVLLGSGGGIHNAKSYLGTSDFFVMNGDEVILPHHLGVLKDMIKFHEWHKGIATLLVMKHPEVGHKFGGAWVKDGTKVNCFSKKQPSPDLTGFHYAGVMILSPKIFSYFKDQVVDENILYETLTEAMKQHEVHVFEDQFEWFETGNPVDFLSATEKCVQAIEERNPAYWVEWLKQTIRLCSINETMIEKEKPDLKTRLEKLIPLIRKGL